MKKKISTVFFATVAALCLCFGLAACGLTDSETGHTHTFAAGWSHDEETHWHAATCGHDSERSGETAHTYQNGKCTECNYEHEAHTFVYSEKTEEGHTGACSVCGKAVTEGHTYQNGKCTACDYEHAGHTFVYSEKTEEGHTGACSACGKAVTEAHTYQNGKCTACDYEHAGHTFVYSEKTEEGHTGTCSVCGKFVKEVHTYQNGVCTDCEYAHQNHSYQNGICEECGYEHTEHTFVYSEMTDDGHTGTCSVCGKVVKEKHTYQNGACEDCGCGHDAHTFVYSEKTEEEHTGICSVCGKFVKERHTYRNGACEDCGYEHTTHAFVYSEKTEEEHTGACSVCGKVVKEKHAYQSGMCEDCDYVHEGHAFVYSEKTEEEHTGTCSVCGKVATERHSYKKGVCTDCDYEHEGHTLVYSDPTEEGHTETCSVCGKIVTKKHTYQNGVCTDCDYEHQYHSYRNGVCTTCGYEHTEHTFVYSDKTEEQHTETCSVCGKTETVAHTYETGVCTACRYVHQNHSYGEDDLCEVCGAKRPYTRSADGNTIYFGEYPQSEVKESDLKASLGWEAGANPTSSDAGKWTDYGYYIEGSVQSFMWYIDVEYQENRYRGVYFTSYRPYNVEYSSTTENTYQDENGYDPNTVYWFKYEPIRWRIMEEKDGTALLLSRIILDSQHYYHDLNDRDGAIHPNNYKESDIRKWLTGTFYEMAFDRSAQEIIETTTVDNSSASTATNSNAYVCENTQDKVFLLSYKDAVNTSYGFNSDNSKWDAARRIQSTAYAKSQGIKVYTSGTFKGNSAWWFRSPGNDNGEGAGNGGEMGHANAGGLLVTSARVGVLPALRIKL